VVETNAEEVQMYTRRQRLGGSEGEEHTWWEAAELEEGRTAVVDCWQTTECGQERGKVRVEQELWRCHGVESESKGGGERSERGEVVFRWDSNVGGAEFRRRWGPVRVRVGGTGRQPNQGLGVGCGGLQEGRAAGIAGLKQHRKRQRQEKTPRSVGATARGSSRGRSTRDDGKYRGVVGWGRATKERQQLGVASKNGGKVL
jgi:hypothetical protein